MAIPPRPISPSISNAGPSAWPSRAMRSASGLNDGDCITVAGDLRHEARLIWGENELARPARRWVASQGDPARGEWQLAAGAVWEPPKDPSGFMVGRWRRRGRRSCETP